MERNISFYKVIDNLVTNNAKVQHISGSCISTKELKEQAIRLYKKYKCDGILIINIKENIWGDNIGGYELYYDGKQFSHDTLNISFLKRKK